jgi:hypothetical protein
MLGAGGTCEFSSQTLRSDRRVAQVAPASARASGRLLPAAGYLCRLPTCTYVGPGQTGFYPLCICRAEQDWQGCPQRTSGETAREVSSLVNAVNARGSRGGRIRCHLVAGVEIVHCAGETLSGFRWLPAARMSAWQGRRTLASPRLPQGCRGHGWRCGRLSRNDDFVGDHHWLARRDASRRR